ncbi:MAG: TlpA family protein disulfide reductase [Deltaproteobacteria bacterium]|nr:TlpA family protein disulfide reductase [Deltaproteobacteria bacterium]
MRRLAAICLAFAYCAFVPGDARALQAPNFDLASPVGAPWRGRVRLRDERGKPVVLVFWAASCRHCHADMVAFERMYRRLRARRVQVVGVATDDARSTPALAGTIRRLGLSFPIVADPGGRTCVRYDPLRAFPLAVVVGRRGELLRSVELRSRARFQEIERFVAELVGAPVEPADDEDDDDEDAAAEREEQRRSPRRHRRDDREPDDDAERDDEDADAEDGDASRETDDEDDDEDADRDDADGDDDAGEGDEADR